MSKVKIAVELANQALVEFRRSGSAEGRVAALQLVVELSMTLGDLFAANLAATDELAMIKRSGDKASEAKALQLLADVHAARGDGNGAIAALTTVATMQKEIGDKAGEAKALHSLAEVRLAMGKTDQALAPANDAYELYKSIGDSAGEMAAARTVSVIYAEKGQLDKAPGRADALQALKDLGEAVENKSAEGFASAMEALKKTGAYNERDMESVTTLALEKDDSVAVFMQQQGLAVPGSGVPMTCINEVMKTMTYIGFRAGGLGYGPRFRCLQSYKKIVPGKPETLMALSALQVSDAADDWEVNLQFHPGVLDGMLQSGSAYAA
mmetsp:Transcript_18885/g.49907  ORF Transcript_18885/g.49907 Transcript_18885/m.49907 type:complete len:324 (-) Transcript_18885:26-997(-)